MLINLLKEKSEPKLSTHAQGHTGDSPTQEWIPGTR